MPKGEINVGTLEVETRINKNKQAEKVVGRYMGALK
jgi:hypothetical protein